MDTLAWVAVGLAAVISFVLGAAVMYFTCRQDEKEFNALQAEYEELQHEYFQLRSTSR